MQEPTVAQRPPANGGMLKKLLALLSDTATYGMSNVIGQVVQFLLLPVYTRYLGPAEYGVYAMLAIVTLLFGPLANLGMTNAIFRRFNQAPDDAAARRVLSTGLFSVILGSLATLAVGLSLAGLIAKDFVGDAATTDLVRLSLLSATFNIIAQVPNVALRARRKVKTAATLNLVNVVVSIGSTIALVVGLEMGVKGMVLAGLAADTAFLILALACTWRSFEPRIDRSTWKSMLSYGLPFVPHRIQAVALAQFSQYIVREMLGLDQAGIYSMAARFALPVGVIVNAIQEAWIPFKFQVHARESDARPFFRSIFTYYVAGVSYLWVGVSVWGFDVLREMTTPAYHAAAYLVPMLALLRVSLGIYFMIGTGMELSDKTGAYPLISLTGLVTVVVGAFLLVGPLGAFGAALASVICWLAMAVLTYVLAQRRLHIAYEWRTIGCFCLLSIACVVAAYAVQNLPLSMRLTFNATVSLVYPLVGLVLLARSPAERERMQILFFKLRKLRRANF